MKKRYIFIISVVVVLAVSIIVIVWTNGTGFKGKTLWDWMELLIIPMILAGGVIYFSRTEKNNELRIASESQQEAILQNYLDKMSELLLKENLMEHKHIGQDIKNGDFSFDDMKDPTYAVAQARTVTTIRALDKKYRNYLLQFLRDANLNDFILVRASLKDADLTEANFYGTNLTKAQMQRANLTKANFNNADLSGADMMEANLAKANLNDADLYKTSLYKANLFCVKNILDEQLMSALTLNGAILPDGTTHVYVRDSENVI